MKAASREAQQQVQSELSQLIESSGDAVATGAQVGAELFLVVDQLDRERALRVVIADTSLPPEARAGIVGDVFGGKVAEPTRKVLTSAVGKEWSNPRELREGLVNTGRRALLAAAEQQGQLERVERELFELSVLLEHEQELTQLLSDRTATSDQRRGLFSDVIYGHVSMFTEALALQVIGRPVKNPVDDLTAVSGQVAELRGKTVARVTTAGELTESQEAGLAAKLESIYGTEIAIHSEVDPSLIGGAVVRVGDEVIDGSTRGKIARLRADLAESAAY